MPSSLPKPTFTASFSAGLGARILEAVDVAALVAELQRIGGTSGTATSYQVSLSNIDFSRAAAPMRM